MRISLNRFTVDVTAGNAHITNFKRDGNNYFALPDKTEYTIVLGNNRTTRCDAHVYIDGEKVGVWRINSDSSIRIERPANVSRKFTFLKEGSYDAHNAGIKCGKTDNGLLKVIFKPEQELYFKSRGCLSFGECMPNVRLESLYNNSLNDSLSFSSNTFNTQSYSSGATALGDHSSQNFSSTSPITEIDNDNITAIYARLVVNDDYLAHDPRRFVSLHEANLSTNIPPRIDTPIYY